MSQEGTGAGGRAQPSVAVLAQALRCKCAADAQGGGQASLEKGLGPPGSEEGRASARPPTRRSAAQQASWTIYKTHIEDTQRPHTENIHRCTGPRNYAWGQVPLLGVLVPFAPGDAVRGSIE